MAAVSAIRGGAKFKAEMIGLKEVSVTLRDLMNGIANEKDLSVGEKSAVTKLAHQMLQTHLGEAAGVIRDAARTNAASSNWPAAVVRAIFKYSDLKDSERRKQRGALAGIRTGAPTRGRAAVLRSGPTMKRRVDKDGIYIEWNAGYNMGPISRKRQRGVRKAASTGGGKKIGMSLARVMESGTAHNKATRAFRRAVLGKRQEVLNRATAGYQSVVKFIAAKHGKRAV
jgi:hypothetical protein